MRIRGIARKRVVCGISCKGKTGQRGRGSEMERVSKDKKGNARRLGWICGVRGSEIEMGTKEGRELGEYQKPREERREGRRMLYEKIKR